MQIHFGMTCPAAPETPACRSLWKTPAAAGSICRTGGETFVAVSTARSNAACSPYLFWLGTARICEASNDFEKPLLNLSGRRESES